MKVEVLYVAECPSHPAAVKLVKEVLAAEGLATEIQEVLVRDKGMADELRFSGSPTIRINGRDVAGESQKAQRFALSCRLYPESKQVGLPPVEVIHQAVLAAQQETSRENWYGHLGLIGGDPEFRRDDQLLPSARIRCGSRRWRRERFLRDVASLAFGSLRSVAWSRILATASCETVRRPG